MVLLRHLLGDALRRLRLRQGRTLREVSATARVSLGYLSEVERGRKEASSELLASICDALGAPLSQVLREVSDGFALAELQSEPAFDVPLEPALVKNPAVLARNPAVLARNPAVLARNPAVLARNPAVLARNPAVLARGPELARSQQVQERIEDAAEETAAAGSAPQPRRTVRIPQNGARQRLVMPQRAMKVGADMPQPQPEPVLEPVTLPGPPPNFDKLQDITDMVPV